MSAQQSDQQQKTRQLTSIIHHSMCSSMSSSVHRAFTSGQRALAFSTRFVDLFGWDWDKNRTNKAWTMQTLVRPEERLLVAWSPIIHHFRTLYIHACSILLDLKSTTKLKEPYMFGKKKDRFLLWISDQCALAGRVLARTLRNSNQNASQGG